MIHKCKVQRLDGKVQRLDKRLTEAAAMKKGVVEAPMLKTVTTNLEGKDETASLESSASESAVLNILSTMLSEGDPELVRVNRVGNHTLVPISFRIQRPCVYCKKNNGRFRGGQVCRSYYECNICQVSLCRPQSRPCFLKYHEDMVGKIPRK